MAFSLKEHFKNSLDLRNAPELECDTCRHRFRVEAQGGERAFPTVRFTCSRCPDLVVFKGNGLYACIDFHRVDRKYVDSIVQKNLGSCPCDKGEFRLDDEIYCPACHHPLGDWVWSYFFVSRLGRQAFQGEAAWRDYLLFWKKTGGDPRSFKRIVERVNQLGKEGAIRLGEETRAFIEVKTRFYFISRHCYEDVEIVKDRPSPELFELVGHTLEKSVLDGAEEDLADFYNAAFYMARFAGRGFERMSGISVSGKESERESSNKMDRDIDRMKRVVEMLKKEHFARQKDADVLEKARLDEMRTKISFWREWWLQNKGKIIS